MGLRSFQSVVAEHSDASHDRQWSSWYKLVGTDSDDVREESFVSDFPEKVEEEPPVSAENIFKLLELARLQHDFRVMLGNSFITRKGLGFHDHREQLSYEQETIFRATVRWFTSPNHVEELQPVSHVSPRESMLTLLGERATQLKLAREEVRSRFQMVMAMTGRAQRLHTVRKENPDDQKLFAECFEQPPKKPLEVVQGPMSLHFRCKTHEDYYLAYRGGKNAAKLEGNHLERALRSGGVAHRHQFYFPPAVHRSVTVEKDTLDATFCSLGMSVFDHEESHIYHDFFPPAPVFIEDKPTLEDTLRECRVVCADTRAASEILSNFRDGRSPTIKQVWNDLQSPNYQFARWTKADLRQKLRSYRSKTQTKIKRLMNDVFDKEYELVVYAGIKALFALRERGLHDLHIEPLCIGRPLNEWPQLVEEFDAMVDRFEVELSA